MASSSSPWRALNLSTVLCHVSVGIASASFWRGAWYMLDDSLFPDEPVQSAMASLGLGTIGMAASQGLVAKTEETWSSSNARSSKYRSVMKSSLSSQVFIISTATKQRIGRIGVLYVMAGSVVLLWRGTWMMWDLAYETYHYCPVKEVGPSATDKGHRLQSGIVSHVSAMVLLISCGLFASVLAPPAAVCVLRDAAVKTSTSTSGTAAATMAAKYYPSASHAGSSSAPAQVLADRLWGIGQHQQHSALHTFLRPKGGGSNLSSVRLSSSAPKHISPLNDRVLVGSSYQLPFAANRWTSPGVTLQSSKRSLSNKSVHHR